MTENKEQNLNSGASARKVVASAIDNNCLILEEPGTGHKISWPLDKIPGPLDLGNELALILAHPHAFSIPTKNRNIEMTAAPDIKPAGSHANVSADGEIGALAGGEIGVSANGAAGVNALYPLRLQPHDSKEDIMRKMLEELVN